MRRGGRGGGGDIVENDHVTETVETKYLSSLDLSEIEEILLNNDCHPLVATNTTKNGQNCDSFLLLNDAFKGSPPTDFTFL